MQKDMSRNPLNLREFVLYGIVVALGLLVDISLLYLLTVYFGVWYLLSAGIAFTTALFLNYMLVRRFVFVHRSLENTHQEFFIFTLIGISALLLNQIVMYISVDIFMASLLLAKGVALPVTFSWSFGLNKFLLFRDG